MSFIQPCFIRKYSDELSKKLSDIGYHTAHCGSGYTYIECAGQWASTSSNLYEEDLEGYIDCGTDEELFLSLASLRDDSDYLQWFVSSKGEWVLCEREKFRQEHMTTFNRTWHKATAQEIVEYFSRKEGQP